MKVKDIKNLKSISAFAGNFATFTTTENKCGIINRQGVILFPADKYDDAFHIGNGVFGLQMYDGTPGNTYFDANKQEVVDSNVIWYLDINGGVSVFIKDNKRGLYDRNKKVLIPAEYDLLFPWCDCFWALKDGKWGTLDRKGKVLLPFEYDKIVSCAHHKDFDPQYGVIKNGKASIINPQGEALTKGDYEYIETFNDGGFAIMKQNGKIGVIDRLENIICMTEFTEVEKRDEGRYSRVFWCQTDRIAFYQDGLFGMMDVRGNVIVPAKYEKIGWNYQDGKIEVKKNGLAGYIDCNGTTLIPCQYKYVIWSRRFNAYKVRTTDNKRGILNCRGEVLIPAVYAYIDIDNYNGLNEIAVSKDGRCYFINDKQEEIDVF